jgi:hypothetical protein
MNNRKQTLAPIPGMTGNPWSRLADIAERLDVPKKDFDAKSSFYVNTGRGRYDLFDVIEAALDYIDHKVTVMEIRLHG